MKKKHSEVMGELKTVIQLNRQQVQFRNSHLNKYHFLRYNLDEALVLQISIDL